MYFQSSFCLVETTYKGKKAIGIRAESIPGINWKLYNNIRDKFRHRDDIANFRQAGSFGHEVCNDYRISSYKRLSQINA